MSQPKGNLGKRITDARSQGQYVRAKSWDIKGNRSSRRSDRRQSKLDISRRY